MCRAELERIIGKCLEKDRELRYQNASEIRADLQILLRDFDAVNSRKAVQSPRQDSSSVRQSAGISVASGRRLRRGLFLLQSCT